MKLTALTVVTLLTVLSLPAWSVTRTVDWSGMGDYTNIWGAVAAASDGDTILVLPGTYTGAQNTGMYFNGKNLAFISSAGPDVTIIDGELVRSGFQIADSMQDSTTVVSGFTFLSCWTSGGGAAIEIANGAPIIEGCVFEGCSSTGNAGAINLANCSATVRDCVFRSCSADYRGGALYCYNSNTTISRCLFDGNVASDTFRGGAIFANYSMDTISGCTFTENEHDGLRVYYSPDFSMVDCIIAGTTEGLAVNDDVVDGTEYRHCVVFGNAGGDSLTDHRHDNLFVDPLFCDEPSDDYTHCSDSQCLPAMNSWGELIGVYADGCGPCDTPVEESSWGALKARFR